MLSSEEEKNNTKNQSYTKKCKRSSLITFLQESNGLSEKLVKTTFCTKGEINSKKQPKNYLREKRMNDKTFIIGEVQAKKSIRRMPWHREPTKDVTNCDKLRGAVNKL